MEDLLQVGVITTTHGVRGEVKVFPTTDDPARFKKLKNVVLDTGKELVDLEVAGVKFFKNMVIVKFKGIDNINDVEKYRKKSLYVTRENAVKLKKNEYFIADLIGLQAESDEGEDLGELSDVLQTCTFPSKIPSFVSISNFRILTLSCREIIWVISFKSPMPSIPLI